LVSLTKVLISYKYYIYYSIKQRKSKFYGISSFSGFHKQENLKNGLNYKNRIQYNAVSVSKPEDRFLGEKK